MFEFAVLADRGGLAVALAPLAGNAERRDGLLRQQRAELLADVDQLGEVLDIAAGERVLDHRDRGGAAGRRLDRAAPSSRVSSTKVTILRIFAFIAGRPSP